MSNRKTLNLANKTHKMKLKLIRKMNCFFQVAVMLNYMVVCLAVTDFNSTIELDALLAIKSYITSDPYGILAVNWSTNTSFCYWNGVYCGSRNRGVTSLSLLNMDLKGTIAPHIGNLSSLTSLDIGHNRFHGTIPEELVFLRNLNNLNLNDNEFSGDVPSWFGGLYNLQYLHMEYNNFTGSVPPSIGNISNLEVLNISFNYLQGKIPEEIGKLSKLKDLYLKYNRLSGALPFINMSSLEEIDLTSNMLSDNFRVDMCDHLPRLKRLHISENKFQGKIPPTIMNCQQLQYLNISFNVFYGSIPREIGNVTALKYLHLGGNHLQGQVPVELGNLINLEVLSILNNSLTGFPSTIFNISSLKMVDFTGNDMYGSLPDDMVNFDHSNLKELSLSSNHLTGKIPSSLWRCRSLERISLSSNEFIGFLPKEIGNLTMLKFLYLGGNNMTGEIPREIKGLINMEELSFREGEFSGQLPLELLNISTLRIIDLRGNHYSGHIPSSMGLRLPNLERLILSLNKFSGPIPTSITNASKLSVIILGSNWFSGPVPSNIGDLRFLQRLFIGLNNLTGERFNPELRFLSSLTNCRNLMMLSIALNPFDGFLPSSLGNLSASLYHLQAFGNKIKGKIPIGIGNLSSLRYLGLDNNELTGPIPDSLGRLQHLEVLYLEKNKLAGYIPHDLCQLKTLGDLYVSENELSGSIPACLGGLKSLRSLYLDSNKLTSTIPLNLWNLKDLVLLNLSRNSLSGYLPPTVGTFKVLKLLHLSHNQLSGSIPSSIGGSQQLSSVSLAHNRFEGSIPKSVGNLIGLEYLDLSMNNLSGSIPKSIERLRYLQFFNVSMNGLHGEIPAGGNFLNYTALSFIGNDGLCGIPRLLVPQCRTRTVRRSHPGFVSLLKYILPFMVLASFIVTLAVWFIRHRRRNIRAMTTGESALVKWRRISYNEHVRATYFYCESNLLGTGGFGSVYKGTLSDGMIVAIKVFNLQHEGAMRSFDTECKVLQQIRHRNIVRIISSCTNLDFRALVLEYMPNGSLDKWLYSHNYCLDISQRLNIMLDVAFALEYLHHGQETPIIHCDLKTNNILLDEDMVGHVCDLGLSKILGEDEFMGRTMTLATVGYMAPEYGREGIVSTRGDVYSYGIILFETFTRMKPTDEMFSNEMSLRSWVSVAILDGSITEVVDENMLESDVKRLSAQKNCLSSVLALALDCTTVFAADRISMGAVVVRLQKMKARFLESLSE